MRQKPPKNKKSKKGQPAVQPAAKPKPKESKRVQIALGTKNYVVMGAGLATIIVGFITLAGGSMTLAPLLLVVGYCVLIPVSLLLK